MDISSQHLNEPNTFGTWVAMIQQQYGQESARKWLEDFTDGYFAICTDVFPGFLDFLDDPTFSPTSAPDSTRDRFRPLSAVPCSVQESMDTGPEVDGSPFGPVTPNTSHETRAE